MDIEKFIKENQSTYKILAKHIVDENVNDFEDALQELYATSVKYFKRWYKDGYMSPKTFLTNYIYKRSRNNFYVNQGLVKIPHHRLGKTHIKYTSLDKEAYDEGNQVTELDLLEYEELSIDEKIDEILRTEYIQKMLSRLPNRYKDVINMYYGIGTDKKNLREIGDIYGCSEKRIHQIKTQSINRILKNRNRDGNYLEVLKEW